MKIAVIGAGSAGLAALRHCTSGTYDIQVVCYEKTDQLGGTWVYREETGLDQYGLPIHTSMYNNLRQVNDKQMQISYGTMLFYFNYFHLLFIIQNESSKGSYGIS